MDGHIVAELLAFRRRPGLDQVVSAIQRHLVKSWTAAEREQLRNDVPVQALSARIKGVTVNEVAREALRLSRLGLKNRRRINGKSQDETIYLGPLEAIVGAGRTVSDDLLARYHGAWKGDIDRIFEEFAF